MEKDAKIYVAGHRGLAGSALMRALMRQGYTNIVVRTHAELELRDSRAVADFFATEKPEYVFLAAARVGGIVANNTYPAEFLFDNLQIQNNIIHQSYLSQVKKLLFLGSSCVYPRDCAQPIKETYLLTGALESTNEPYAIAKIAGIKMCESYNRQYGTNFIAVMPSNLYGPGDNFHHETSHVIPGIMRKLHEAKERAQESVSLWGTGHVRREFLYVDDAADACVFLMNTFEYRVSEPVFVNVGSGTDMTVEELAQEINRVVGFSGTIVWDTSRPSGTPQKVLDVSRMRALGWESHVSLREGLEKTYQWFLNQIV